MLTKLKILRVEKGMSQSDLAQALGTTQVTVSAWETGRSTPRPPMMQKIADYFGVSKDDIFFRAFNYSK
ncbi:helix-turn-helix transcriptional regulator [Lactobacillus crispatus]|jgi:hypothetical protein|uniref:XRE family transcriptional regulator n=1 Tax=Lactobacillus crispatus TaxID=47770 RepID=A0A4Q0LUE3_9LACO|nr:helix-turn-helix transcriptional regulator [Lactobacillus crispatus]AZR16029.1 XRE family transcriptional regulator [Lactobacillus crispatus]EKB63905.1 hypothetical protein HMPREF9250_00122 [Lactobacillus crispatus FB049-03]KWU12708.1 DNA-binding protein [Lactobacillus crispatus]MBG0732711.1 helix-turn-helix transcriptional regulator [Lactobacillus crispatus]MBG0737233.1 helix-turn-helix transcriptional regulator [Lactobacillus crispatus]